MLQNRISQTQVAFGVFEVDWVYFVRHGGRADFTGDGFLLEVVQGDVAPHVTIEVDLDLIGQVDAETFRVKRPSFYAELIWDLRKERARADGATVDWVVLRNRLQHIDAHNMRRVGKALVELSKRVGFRTISGLGERVIYRELFPKGLTLLDVDAIGGIGLSHIAARQELRELVAGLALPVRESDQPELAFA